MSSIGMNRDNLNVKTRTDAFWGQGSGRGSLYLSPLRGARGVTIPFLDLTFVCII